MTSEERRAKLSGWLHDILGSDNVYFEPGESIHMQYPAIRYRREVIDTVKADNVTYLRHDRYVITFIRKESASDIVDKLLELPYCEYDRPYTADDLYHDVFSIYV